MLLLLIIVLLLVCLLSRNNDASRFVSGLLAAVLVVFVIGMLIDPEATRNYSLRIIDALADVFRAIRRALSR